MQEQCAQVQEGLRDAIGRNDAVSLLWLGSPTDSMEDVYDYVFDHQISFQMFYADGVNPPKVFRDAENGTVQKVRDPYKSALQSVENGGKVLYLWSDEESDDQVEPIFETIERGTLVLELTNGLAPISIDMDIPEPVEREAIKDDDEADDDSSFSKDELETMTAFAVKRYGERLGLKATTKSGIIAELFPVSPSGEDDEEGEVEPTKDPVDAVAAPSPLIKEGDPELVKMLDDEEEFRQVLANISTGLTILSTALTLLAKKVYSS
jgi:hypothetical protein